MKTKSLYIVTFVSIFGLYSCIETTLTNIIHADGSITRRIVIKDNEDKKFSSYANRVPYDSSWNVSDTFEIGEKNDTTWIRTVEKHFLNVADINNTYATDSGCNMEFNREAIFEKKFHWFNTVYRYSENIDAILSYGIPIENYLSKQELEYFYLPEDVISERLKGADSTVIKQIIDSVEIKSDEWSLRNIISEWKGEFIILLENKGLAAQYKEFLNDKDDEFYAKLQILKNDSLSVDIDSTITSCLKDVLGEKMYLENKTEADSAVTIVKQKVDKAMSFSAYSVKTSMPGKMLATNGFIDEKSEILWPLKMEFFFANPYSMSAESKISNTWAWIVSGLFLLFVLTGLILRIKRKPSE